MASTAPHIFILSVSLLISTLYPPAWAQNKTPNIITLGSSLTPTANSSWPSPSGMYAFGFTRLGQAGRYSVGVFLIGVPEKTVVWAGDHALPPLPSNSTLLLTHDGRLTLQAVRIADPPDSISSASMLDSGNFVLYTSARDIIWQSFDYPMDTLLPPQILHEGKDLVASASDSDKDVDRRCHLGFDFVNPRNRRLGCERNFAAQSCKTRDNRSGSTGFSMAELGNTVWEDISYSQLSYVNKKACQDWCLRDCNCEATLFKDGTCRKKRLPLRFGRRLLSDPSIAFNKVADTSPSPRGNSFLPGKRNPSLVLLITGVSLIALAFVMIVVVSRCDLI